MLMKAPAGGLGEAVINDGKIFVSLKLLPTKTLRGKANLLQETA